jgi:ferritin-like metal-binding protein YciE
MPILKKAHTLHELLLNKLMALYDIELQIVKALPKMAKKAKTPELVQGFEEHLKETQGQVKRLEQCFKLLKIKPKKLRSETIRGLVDDTQWVMQNVQAGPALDANLIAAAQYVEHYEIAGYGTAIEWASLMDHTKVAELLNQTLEEEEMADEKLTTIAENQVNSQVEMGM